MSEQSTERLARRLADLPPDRRRLVEQMLHGQAKAPRASRIPRRSSSATTSATTPTSYAQRRMWLLEQMAPGTAAHNVDFLMRVPGSYNVPALERAINEMLRRHESLRTTFGLEDSEPVQVIAPRLELRLPVVDLRYLPKPDREAEGIARASQDARVPFDLGTAPLIRTKLLRLDEAEYLFLVTMHHIVSDYVSMVVFFEELSAIYNAFAHGLPSPLGDVPLQYADFAAWQRERMRGELRDSQLAYWRQQLAGIQPVRLPTDRPRPAVASIAGATEIAALPADIVARVHELSREQGVTPFKTILAAFKVLLFRYTGETDLSVGVPVANRSMTELERVIGFFVNSLVMRTDLSGDPTFRALVGRVARTVTDGLANQDVPFEALVEDLHPARRLNQNPLFQVACQLLPLKHSTRIAPRIWLDRGTSAIDLALELIDSPEGMTVRAEYATSLFDAETIRRLLSHYERLLRAVMRNPEARISQVDLCEPAERDRLLHEWSRGPRMETTGLQPVHRMIEAQVQRAPERIAIVSGDECRTYADLNRAANRLARRLRERGVRAETLVAICLPRSFELYAAMLAAWKAGGAYLPLDPEQPARRLEAIVTNARPAAIVTTSDLEARLPAGDAAVIRLALDRAPHEDDSDPTDASDSIDPERPVALDDLAYVIYTSGSTGRPKGVLVPHRAIAHQLRWMQEACPLDPSDCALQKYSIAFDASAVEIFHTLIAGAQLVVPTAATARDPAALVGLMAKHGVTVIDAVPSQLALLLDEPAFPRTCRRVISGGEPLSIELLARLRQAGIPQIVNMYGPTEATITATCWMDDGREVTGRVPIGRPIANTYAYVLAEHQQLVPVGISGELYLGGIGLARGYLGLDALTASAFVPNPFGDPDAPRLYRTGDRMRVRPDGDLEYVGRTDRQVKVRGGRVELQDLEAVLCEHPAIADCAVAADRDDETARLTACVVPSGPPPELWPSVGEYFIYDELLYHAMSSDTRRNRAYRAAIDAVVPGKVVVDIGTGRDALWARACVEAGARRVYAIEMIEEAARAASALVARLGLTDRLTVIHGDVRRLDLPEPVDAIVSELIGTIGSSEGVVPILNDARRLLAPGGVMIPQQCLTRIAAIELPAGLTEYPCFTEVSSHYVRRIFEAAGGPHDVRVCVKGISRDHLVSDAAIVEALDFSGVVPLGSEVSFTLTMTRDGVVQGLLLWIQLSPGGGITIDTLDGGYSWLPVFFPVFHPGQRVRPGDRLDATASVVYPNDSNDSNGRSTPDYFAKGQLIRQGHPPLAFEHRSSVGAGAFRRGPFYEALLHRDGTPRADGVLSTPALRAWLKPRLPELMIPAAFRVVDRLPRTPAGKLDASVLAADLHEARPTYVAPQSEIERAIARVWQEVLGIEHVGIHDNFFDVGGHSLLLVRLQRRLCEVLDTDVSLMDLFQSPTIADLAAVLRDSHAASPASL